MIKKLLVIVFVSLLLSGNTYVVAEKKSNFFMFDREFLPLAPSSSFDGLPKISPKKQFYYATKLKNTYRGAWAYLEFIKENPNHEWVPYALYNYGKRTETGSFPYNTTVEVLANKSTVFETIIKNFPKMPRELYVKVYIANIEKLDALLRHRDITLSNEEREFFRKRLCNIFDTKIKKNISINKKQKKYQLMHACSQINNALTKNVSAPKESNKTLTGFSVDLVKDNEDLKKEFKKFEVIFDFKNLKVERIISLNPKKYSKVINKDNIKRNYEIVSMIDGKIRMQQTYIEWRKFCSFRINKTAKRIREEPQSPFYNECEYKHPITKDNEDIWQATPYVYLDFDMDKKEFKKTFFPAYKEYKVSESLYAPKNKVEKFSDFIFSEQGERLIDTIFLVATIYTTIKNIDNIKNISKKTNNTKKINPKLSDNTSANSYDTFMDRPLSQRVVILRRYGYLN